MKEQEPRSLSEYDIIKKGKMSEREPLCAKKCKNFLPSTSERGVLRGFCVAKRQSVQCGGLSDLCKSPELFKPLVFQQPKAQ